MNETSATSASGLSLLPDGIATLTAIHFTIIAVVAILVVIGLIWGIRAKRSRVKAAHDVIANAQEAGVPPEPLSAEPGVQARKAEQSQAQTQIAPVPVAPVPVTPTPARPQPEPPRTEPTQPVPSLRSASEQTPVSRDDGLPERPDRRADEPIAAVAPLDASPVTQAVAPAPVAPTEQARAEQARAEQARAETRAPVQSYADDPVTQLKGLGPKVAAQLGALGVSTVGQMAALSDAEAQRIDAQLGNFTGRMGRDRWIEQARLLAAGDKAGFEAVFGKL